MRGLIRPRRGDRRAAALPEGLGPVIDPRRAPITVVDLDVDAARAQPIGRETAGGPRSADQVALLGGEVLVLARRHGRPIGMFTASLRHSAHPGEELAAIALRELSEAIAAHDADDYAAGPDPEACGTASAPCALRRRRSLAKPPSVSVVVATRERPEQLSRCLETLLRQDYPDFEIIVVDNAPATDDTARLIEGRFPGRVAYVREPVRGLAAAHNRALELAVGELIAFTDDDVFVDRQWLSAIAEAFADNPNAGCVTGLILPARLETAAQAMLERRGGFGKGFRRVEHSLFAPGRHPLFPFTAGRLGSGANMAFSARALRALGGFDPATGTGTAARGGDDLLAFFRVAAAGHSVVYQPDALVWHVHRSDRAALAKQAFGYGVGLGAFLTAALVHEPRMLLPLMRRLPRGIAYAARNSRPDSAASGAWPAALARRERWGLVLGPLAYALSRHRSRAFAELAGGADG
jgi:GT2 family glycosyltransferase